MSLPSNSYLIIKKSNGSYEIRCQDCNHAIILTNTPQWNEVNRRKGAYGVEVVYCLETRCQNCGSLFEVSIVEYPEAVINRVAISFNKKSIFIDYRSYSDFFETAIVGHQKQRPQLGYIPLPSETLYRSVLDDHLRHIESRDLLAGYRLLGLLAYWHSVEPQNSYVISSSKALGKLLRGH